VAFDREDTLKKAEKLLRQGRLEPAIAEYLRVVEADPADWITANTLGDLYGRAGQPDKAAAQYGRVAEHFMSDGFYPKAAAIFKKLLKLNPQDEASQLQLADISQRQGLLADAKAYLNTVAARRRERGDRAGAAEIVVRLGSVDPNDFEARLAAARMVAETGDEEGAASRFRAIHDDLVEKGRLPEALKALREAVNLNPHDRDGRVMLARAAVASGDLEGARAFLDRETAAEDATLLTALVEVELTSGRFDEAAELLPRLLALDRAQRQKVIELAWATIETSPAAAFVLINAAVDHATAAEEFAEAAGLLQEFATRVPNQIPALLKFVEVCVDGGLEATMNEAQAMLADAYLAVGQATEARVTAEDLVAREPWVRDHIERFRRALVMLKVSDPDTVIAERLSGESPFLATDLFAQPAVSEPPPEQAVRAVETPPLEAPDAAAPYGEREPVEEPDVTPPARPEPIKPSVLPPLAEARAEAPEIDLTNALGGLDAGVDAGSTPGASPGGSLEDMFQGMRQQATRESGHDQSAQHMTLARTYLEMGLPDQAIASLGAAAQSPRCRFEAASLLGRIHKDRGEFSQAAEWLERASEAPAPSPEEGRAVVYDLGTMLEQTGETARALALYLELQAEAGGYRDVAERAERLARVETETERGG
jgi:tetratricopeptide (TPR) repeat protein